MGGKSLWEEMKLQDLRSFREQAYLLQQEIQRNEEKRNEFLKLYYEYQNKHRSICILLAKQKDEQIKIFKKAFCINEENGNGIK